MQPFNCSICLDDLGEGPTEVRDGINYISDNNKISATPCGHVFHDACLAQCRVNWEADFFRGAPFRCPYCRKVFDEVQIKQLLFITRSNLEVDHLTDREEVKYKNTSELRSLVYDLSKRLAYAEKSAGAATEHRKSLEGSLEKVTLEKETVKLEKEHLQNRLIEKGAEVTTLMKEKKLLTEEVDRLNVRIRLKSGLRFRNNGTECPVRRTARMSTGGLGPNRSRFQDRNLRSARDSTPISVSSSDDSSVAEVPIVPPPAPPPAPVLMRAQNDGIHIPIVFRTRTMRTMTVNRMRQMAVINIERLPVARMSAPTMSAGVRAPTPVSRDNHPRYSLRARNLLRAPERLDPPARTGNRARARRS